jgi:hypothetical protein
MILYLYVMNAFDNRHLADLHNKQICEKWAELINIQMSYIRDIFYFGLVFEKHVSLSFLEKKVKHQNTRHPDCLQVIRLVRFFSQIYWKQL